VTMGITFAVLAAVAIAIELHTLTFYLMAVAAAFAIASAIALTGAPAIAALWGLAITAILGLPIAHLLRRHFSKPSTATRALASENTGHMVRVDSVSPEGLRVDYRGTVWQARLADKDFNPPIGVGDMLWIVGQEGNVLLVAPTRGSTAKKQT